MSLKGKYWFLVLFLLITASCGFQPIYKIGNKTEQLLEFNLNFQNEPSYETKNTIKNAFMSSETTALYSVDLIVIENRSPLIINSNGNQIRNFVSSNTLVKSIFSIKKKKVCIKDNRYLKVMLILYLDV